MSCKLSKPLNMAPTATGHVQRAKKVSEKKPFCQQFEPHEPTLLYH